MWKKIPTADKTILIGFGSLSLVNIIYWLVLPHKSFNILSILNSCICFVAIYLFVKNKMASYYLFVIWCIVQFPYITRFEGWLQDPFLNLTQTLQFSLGFMFFGEGGGESYHAKLNLLPVFYLGLSYRLYLTLIRGKVFKLIPLKPDTFLHQILPAEFKVVKRIQYKKEKDWVLVIINDEEKNAAGKKGYFMVRTKDKNDRFKPTKKKLQVYLGELDHNMDPKLDYVPEEVVVRGEWAVTA